MRDKVLNIDFLMRVILFVAIYASISYLGSSFQTNIMKPFISLNNFIAEDVNRHGGINYKNISFDQHNNNLQTDIKSNSYKSRSVVSGSYINTNFEIHFWMPFVLLSSLIFVVPSKNKFKFILISFIAYFLFTEFKLWINILDHCNHDAMYDKSGMIVSALLNPTFKDYLLSGLNKILNIKTAVYSRYFIVIMIFAINYIWINKPQLNQIKFFNFTPAKV